MQTTHDYVQAYAALGWAVVAIPAGSKAPQAFGWQTRATDPSHWMQNPTHNVGLLHSLSGTVALDIDHMLHARAIFDALNIDLDAILSTAPRIVGRKDRGKVIFRAPDGVALTTRKISWPVEGDPRRSEVVFELRAGSVQDVLPPSIHPDTGEPYTWAGADWRNPPPIPAALLMIWTEWDRFRPQMMSVCPWVQDTFKPPAKRRKVDDDRESVIDAYNRAVGIEDALEKAGYRRFGNRWLSPNSTSKIPGVIVFDDGRAYSHHASDPFDPAHTFDAFDVFTHYDHLGNIGSAVNSAADWLNMKALPEGPSEEDRERIIHGREIWARLKGGKDYNAPLADIPQHLLTIPGALGELVEYASRTAIKPQRQFDVQAALAFGSVVMGRRWTTDYNNMSSLYFLNIGKTGSGKEHAKNVIEIALEECGLSELIGPAGYTSASGVLSTLKDKPCHITVIDEFGLMLTSANAKGNHHKKEALSMMMEAFGRQRGTLRNTGYSTAAMTEGQKKAMQVQIRHPSLTLLGMTTPETFFDAIGSADVASGFLNRFLIVESRIGRQLSLKPSRSGVPDAVRDWAQYHATAQGGGGNIVTDVGAEFPPDPVMVPFGAAAKAMFDDMERSVMEEQDAISNHALAAMLNRQREIAMRLSLIVARSLGDDEVSTSAAQWAIDYVDMYGRDVRAAMAREMNEGEFDGLRKKAGEAIMDAGSMGLKMAELIAKVPALGNLKKHERDGLLAMVCTDYPIERAVVQNGKGRPAVIHRKVEE